MMAEIITCAVVLAVLAGLLRHMDRQRTVRRRAYDLLEMAEAGMVTIGDVPRTGTASRPPRPTERRQRESSRHYHTGEALAEVRHAIHYAQSDAYLLPLLEVEAQLEALVSAGWREMQERDARARGGAA